MQEEFFKIIQNLVSNNQLSHAYLIEVNSNLDIDLFIKRLAKIILCSDDNDSNIANLIDNDNYPDLRVIDSPSIIKKEELLNLRDDFSNTSILDNKRIYVIKDASKLNQSSANTILKFLEEAPDGVIAILLAKNRYNVLDTIVSRCQVLTLYEESFTDVENDTLELIKLIVNHDNFLNYDKIIEIIPNRECFSEKMQLIQNYLFNLFNKKINNDIIKYEDISKVILVINSYISKMRMNINYKLGIDNLLLDISEVIS